MATQQRKFFVGGNWKCNSSRAEVDKLCAGLNGSLPLPDAAEVVVAPPFVYIDRAHAALKPYFAVSAQNCWTKKGAFTGEVAPEMLKDIGINWAILGHSERRHVIGEKDELIAEKAKVALAAGLSVMYCIGELEKERVENRTNEVLATQMAALAKAITDWSHVVIAYEPVWAIGTGRTATPEQAQEAHLFVRQWMKEHVSAEVSNATRILYGGSVSPANCDVLASLPDVDGFLVGGASLDASKFVPIIKSVKAKL
eukprot:TRINITY_DN4088_c0_g1_i2.p2 TRINITY_DN4088_c0_g1~~TRINITY_DN4088_c0_g1_i2.p2  ORF type:complete len:255 (-),score=91.15 TRINITY_DN4088_c0_g1_i2:58-822(-)